MFKQTRFTSLLTAIVVLVWASAPLSASANGPGPGLTARFEVTYLEFIIDHHYAALRMTELAAGTDLARDPPILPDEGTSPTPDSASTPAKAESDALKSMARRDNRVQREEILTAQRFLREWYNIDYKPHVEPMNQAQIRLLEQTPAGRTFDHFFMEVFSRHHYSALEPSMSCQVASAIDHQELHRYCAGIVHGQINDIQNMRQMLCENVSICDYQPLIGLKGIHSGSEGNEYTDVPSEGMAGG
jgi:uncharacterized protein (DUF305 family)